MKFNRRRVEVEILVVAEEEQEMTVSGHIVVPVEVKDLCWSWLVATVARVDDHLLWKADLSFSFLLTLTKGNLSNFFFLQALSFPEDMIVKKKREEDKCYGITLQSKVVIKNINKPLGGSKRWSTKMKLNVARKPDWERYS